jgi:DNA-binding NtrC family response regulator
MTARQILVVDDEIGIRELLRDILQDEGYHVKLAENASEARRIRQHERPDCVLLDIWMPDCDGISLLKEWVENGSLTMPVVMMSGHGTIDTAVEATRIGAFDFLEKPIALQKLLKTVASALKASEQMPKHAMSLLNLGKGPAITALRERLEQVAKMSAVLIIGEKDAGAEFCAKFLHVPDTPWVELKQTATLTKEPLALLEEARDGVIFVAELSSLNKSEQKGLNFVISQAEKFDVRVICASTSSLSSMTESTQGDEALLQALSNTSLTIPSLVEHSEDIPDLAKAMAAVIIENGESEYREFDVAALNALRNADWPGNLAQLNRVVTNLMHTSLGEKISLNEVERVLKQFAEPRAERRSYGVFNFDQPLREARDAFERLYFEHHIAQTQGNMSKVAEAVQLERTHLYRKLKQLGIK